MYDPLAHWIWGTGGWLKTLGALAFAGGTVVHISSGVSALVAALVLGPRLGLGRDSMDPHDATMAVLGAVLLWFGWFGFNAGSALSVNGAGANGLVYGDSTLLWKQLLAVMVTWVYAAAATWIILKVVDATVGLRVAEQEEVLGLDATQHGETAYQSDKPRWRQPELSATSQDPK